MKKIYLALSLVCLMTIFRPVSALSASGGEFEKALAGNDVAAAKAMLDQTPALSKALTDDYYRRPMIHHARSAEAVELLVKAGADPNARDRNDRTALHGVTDSSAAKALIKAGADPNARDADPGKAPLHMAYDQGIAKVLIEAGCDPNVRDSRGSTPLHYARDTGVVELLLSRGADPNAQNAHGDSPSHEAAQSFDKGRLVMLEKAGANLLAVNERNETPLFNAAPYKECLQNARLLIERGAGVTHASSRGQTPLHLSRSREMAELFLEKGAKLSARDSDGQTPLFKATTPDYAAFLISRGADTSEVDNGGMTPLHMSFLPEMTGFWLDSGINADARTKDGVTPLMLASSMKLEMAEKLIARGADVNRKSLPIAHSRKEKKFRLLTHETPLISAAYYGKKDIAALLLSRGARIDERDSRGRTALHWAYANGKKDVAAFLISKGANPDAADSEGRLPASLSPSE